MLNMEIRAHGFSLTESLDAKVRAAFVPRLERRIDTQGTRLLVELDEESHNRGSRDKRCRAVLFIPREPEVSLTESGPNLYELIDSIAKKLAFTVRRQIDRHHGYSHDRIDTVTPSEG